MILKYVTLIFDIDWNKFSKTLIGNFKQIRRQILMQAITSKQLTVTQSILKYITLYI